MTDNQGQKFYQFVKSKGLKVGYLADKLGVSRQTINDWFGRDELPTKARQLLRQHTDFFGPPPPNEPPTPPKGVPFYDIDISGGAVQLFSDNPELPTLYISAPGFEDCDFGLPIFGNSMYPTYENGVVVMCKKITDKTIIQPGECYLIVTADHRMVKRLLKNKKPGHWLAVSDNPSIDTSTGSKVYGDFEIPMDKVLHLYIIKGCIKRSQL